MFKDPINGAAYTNAQAGEITISAAWVRKHPEDIGMVIHELTHVVQCYPRSKNGADLFWIGEGVADYIRNFEFEPEKRQHIDRKQTYLKRLRDGGRVPGLDPSGHTRRTLVEKLNARLQIGEPTPKSSSKTTPTHRSARCGRTSPQRCIASR